MAMERVAAEAVALLALGWIAEQDDLLAVFLGASGTDASDLRARAQDAEFLAAVLDFLLMDDTWIVGFCKEAGLPPSRPAEARAALPGGDQMHWT